MAETGNWVLVGVGGVRYATLSGMVQRGSTWFAALAPLPDYGRVKPIFDAMGAHMESHGVPAASDLAGSVKALGLHLLDPTGSPRQVRDLAIDEDLASFSLED